MARSDHKGACGDAAGPVVAGTRASQRPQPATVTGQAPYCFGPAPYPLLAQNVPRSALNTDLVACKVRPACVRVRAGVTALVSAGPWPPG